MLLTWDGVLPIGVLLVPSFIQWIAPNNRGVLEITSVVLPILAFFLRAVVGGRHKAANNCSLRFRRLQFTAFGIGIFVLVFLDAVIILSHLMPRGAFSSGDVVVLAILAAVYVGCMAIAMYPGRTNTLPEVISLQ